MWSWFLSPFPFPGFDVSELGAAGAGAGACGAAGAGAVDAAFFELFALAFAREGLAGAVGVAAGGAAGAAADGAEGVAAGEVPGDEGVAGATGWVGGAGLGVGAGVRGGVGAGTGGRDGGGGEGRVTARGRDGAALVSDGPDPRLELTSVKRPPAEARTPVARGRELRPLPAGRPTRPVAITTCSP